MMLISRSSFPKLLRFTRLFTSPAINAKSKIPFYKENGFALFESALPNEDAESLRHSASLLMKGLSEQTNKNAIIPRKPDKNATLDEYLYFSGGKKLETNIREMKLTANVRGIAGDGINVLASGLHVGVESFQNVVRSRIVRRITRDLFGMKAPLIAASLYISALGKTWTNLRKDNSFIRTNPLTTQVFFAKNE